jgi:hypothetical protein
VPESRYRLLLERERPDEDDRPPPCEARPPLAEIARCFSGLIAANPRLLRPELLLLLLRPPRLLEPLLLRAIVTLLFERRAFPATAGVRKKTGDCCP